MIYHDRLRYVGWHEQDRSADCVGAGRAGDVGGLDAGPPALVPAGGAGEDHYDGRRPRSEPRHRRGTEGVAPDRAVVAGPVSGPARGRVGTRCPTARPHAADLGNENSRGGGSHLAYHPARGDALEHAHDGGAQGLSPAMVQRIWQQHNIKPHLVKTFKLSRDPQFIEKLTDVVGLYLNPPDKSLVLCVDEKSQIQALDRTQPGLPLKRGRCGTYTHDDMRNGTTTLFAALSILQGTVIGDCMPRHRHQEFIRFLARIDGDIPTGLDLHLIVDNYGTHKHPRVKAWLRRHPRFHLHFVPTSSSWLHLVERWFRELTDKRIRRGTFNNVPALIAAIQEYLSHHNQQPQVFVWSAPVERILAKIAKCKEALDSLH